MESKFFLTEVAEDWTQENLSVIADVLRESWIAVSERTDKRKDPLFDQPNHPNLVGYVRWIVVGTMLWKASRRFRGITAQWRNAGGVSILELVGKYTIVTPCHLAHPSSQPNDTEYLTDVRIINQVHPLLFSDLAQPPEKSRPLRLSLAHGGKSSRFAFLRAYTNPEDLGVYRDLTQNILLTPVVLESIDYETIPEPEIKLNKAQEKEQSKKSK